MVPSAESTKPSTLYLLPLTLPSSFSSEKPSLICSKTLPQVPGATFLIFPPQPFGSSLFSGLPPLLGETFKDSPSPPKDCSAEDVGGCLSNMDEALGPTPTPLNPPPRPCPFSFLSSGRSNSCIVYLYAFARSCVCFTNSNVSPRGQTLCSLSLNYPSSGVKDVRQLPSTVNSSSCYSPEWLLSVVLGGTQKLLKGSCIRSSRDRRNTPNSRDRFIHPCRCSNLTPNPGRWWP